jgi:peptidoglycan lytic transglycosylase
MHWQRRSLGVGLLTFVFVVLPVKMPWAPALPAPLVSAQTGTRWSAQIGTASWYGRRHHGRETASGEVFDMYRLTAAHRTLPLGSRVLVTAVESGRSVVVTITDRGPYVQGRIIDLSYAAARRLAAVERGVIPVSLHLVPNAPRDRAETAELRGVRRAASR